MQNKWIIIAGSSGANINNCFKKEKVKDHVKKIEVKNE